MLVDVTWALGRELPGACGCSMGIRSGTAWCLATAVSVIILKLGSMHTSA